MDMQLAMSCKKGCFITMIHNDVRDLTGNLLSITYVQMEIEPKLLSVIGEAKLKTRATRQELIFEREESGRGTNRHFLM